MRNDAKLWRKYKSSESFKEFCLCLLLEHRHLLPFIGRLILNRRPINAVYTMRSVQTKSKVDWFREIITKKQLRDRIIKPLEIPVIEHKIHIHTGKGARAHIRIGVKRTIDDSRSLLFVLLFISAKENIQAQTSTRSCVRNTPIQSFTIANDPMKWKRRHWLKLYFCIRFSRSQVLSLYCCCFVARTHWKLRRSFCFRLLRWICNK